MAAAAGDFESLQSLIGPVAAQQLRQRLVRFFRWEGCANNEQCADEVFRRLAAKLAEGERISNPVAQCGTLARAVLKETNRRQAQEQQQPLAGPVERTSPPFVREESESQILVTRQSVAQTLQKLPAESRQLLFDYFRGNGTVRAVSRPKVAARLDVSLSALRVKAMSLREDLEAATKGRNG